MVEFATVVFLIGHVVSLILLAIALWRIRSVPRWAAVCLALYPVFELAGGGSGLRAVGVVAYLLLVVAFGACAQALVRPGIRTESTPAAELRKKSPPRSRKS